MNLTTLAAIVLAAASAGGVAYVLLFPFLSGQAKAAKRQAAVLQSKGPSRIERAGGGQSRRDQVAQSLKELEQKQKARNTLTIEKRITQAGLTWTKGKFIAVSVASGLAAALGAFLLSGEVLAALGAAFAGGFGLPRWVLGFLKNRRLNKYLEELPNAMDVIVRGIRSGLPLNDCIRMIATEAAEPVRSEFRAIVEQQALGISIPEAIGQLYERVPVPESNFFAIVIAIQSKAGGNLSEALSNLSRVLRDRKKMKAKVQAMSQEAKASAGIIAALPFMVALLTYLSSPQYIELLWTTSSGKIALMLSACWMSIGIFIMRKMINFEV